MVSREEILTRNKIIGVLLRTARLRAGESIESCAQVLSCDPEYLTHAEKGRGDSLCPSWRACPIACRSLCPFSWASRTCRRTISSPGHSPMRM